MKKGLTSRIILLIILIVSAVMRFWGEAVFMPDELSALARLRYGGLKEILAQGVAPDGHPAFVQVFLYFWTKLAGWTEYAVKLPSVITGIGTVYLTYSVGRRLFSVNSGLIAAAVWATIQYSVLYSTLARPYIFGTFFCLLQLNLILNEGRRKPWRFWAQLAVVMALSAYTHYFSMLVSGLIVLWGFYLIPRAQWKSYSMSIAGAIILFLPHIPLTLGHLDIGGLGHGWLSAPEPDFIPYYFGWAFQFDPVLISFCVLSLIASVMYLKRHELKAVNLLAALSVVLLPLGIGYWYSVCHNPLLQYSVLIFGFPILLTALFSFSKSLGRTWMFLICGGIMLLNIYQLMVGRQHYEMAQNQGMDKVVELIEAANEIGQKPTVLCLTDPEYFQVYDKTKDLDYTYYQSDELDSIEMDFLDFPIIFLNPRPDHLLSSTQSSRQVLSYYGPSYDAHVMLSETAIYSPPPGLRIFNAFNQLEPNGWEWDEKLLLRWNRNERDFVRYEICSNEWGPVFECNLADMGHRFHTVDFSSYLRWRFSGHPVDYDGRECEVVLVMEIWRRDEMVSWYGGEVSLHLDHQSYHSGRIRIFDVIQAGENLEEYRLKAYFWNKGKDDLMIEGMKVAWFETDKNRYGLFEPIE